ncbi:MAG TPA: aminotransferase class V-fold PLP-dependent enzyme [Gemmatimonadales bacterium]|nr:aminotransferase class V-fold PLP-dependent enzyme [Gemmatimonadales bacterium]
MSTDFAALRREEFPALDEAIYLNSASIGPLPERTRRRIDHFGTLRAAPFRTSDPELFAEFTQARALAARLLNATPEEIALTVNTSYGLNLAAQGLPLDRGDVVVASDREFPANVYPWMRLAERGIALELAPVTAEGWPDEAALLERMADPRVRVVAVSLVQFSNGYRVDLDRLSKRARATDTYLVVDAIQGLGAVPVDLAATPVDLLACGGQKWLLSPWGSGFVYVRKELMTVVDPAVTGWMAFEGTDDFGRLTDYNPRLRSDARRFEMITLPYQDFAGFNTSVGMLLDIGIPAIARHIAGLQAPILDWAVRRGVRISSPVGARGSGIVCVAVPEPARAYKQLRAQGVVAGVREGAIRLSPHLFNTMDEMERVVGMLEKLSPQSSVLSNA